MNYKSLLLLINLFLLLIFSAQNCLNNENSGFSENQYRIIDIFPHDNTAFTQGLVWKGNYFYESTGLYGRSSLRKVEIQTGNVLQKYDLPNDYFGEGITIFKDSIYQLTWKEQTGFIYDQETFQLIDTFSYSYEGWGITHDGKHLIISDGSPVLHFVDPCTMEEVKQVTVYFQKTPVRFINELEYIKGKIFANIWQTKQIAIINTDSGEVTNWLDLGGILDNIEINSSQDIDVLNGIAYDEDKGYLFVTGKFWPNIFQIKIMDNFVQ
ncbi:MAG: glutaminyl-peptide cyclotransferase [Atribacterota bacterium]|nr:glutaminyl-peptide cyclotransferase [Atribacterota bacterium]MDD4895409.1 glutaminyl-peptide cyclotransferase [Atribacterota bacterium]